MRHAQTLICAVAFLWGWSEATWFFVIPDVWLSFAALAGLRMALSSTLCAVLGALGGASTLYVFGAQCPETAEKLPGLWAALPGFRMTMLADAQRHLTAGPWGMQEGAAAGIPFHAYVWLCQQQHIALLNVLQVAPWVRLERMLVAPLTIWASYVCVRAICARLDLGVLPLKRLMAGVIALFWTGVYFYYWGYFIPEHFR